jgi:phage/plasmid-like protein (TIGR03299 family)
MSHMVESMAYNRAQVPWHGLGAPVDPSLSVDEMMQAAGLGWRLEPRRLGYIDLSEATERTSDPDSDFVPTGDNCWIRSLDGKVMVPHAGPDWRPMQNADVFEFFRNWTEAGGVKMETAGSLKGGEIVWCLAKIEDSIDVRGDKVDAYLHLTSRHQYGSAITVDLTTVRVVCANTLASADALVTRSNSGANRRTYRQDHTKDFDATAAKDAVGEAVESLREIEQQYRTLADIKLGMDQAVQEIITPARFGVSYEELMDREAEKAAAKGKAATEPKALRDIRYSIATAPGADPTSAWGMLNGVTHACDHVMGSNKDGARLYRAWYSSGRDLKLDVQKRLMELA